MTDLRRPTTPTADSAGRVAAPAGEADLDEDVARSAIEAMPLGVLIEGSGGHVWINQELVRIWRRREASQPVRGELERDLQSVLPEADGTDPWKKLLGNRNVSRKWRRQVLRRGDGSTVPVRVSTASLRALEGGMATFVFEDHPHEPNARLQEAFLAMVAHELRTPMTSIVAGAELLHGIKLDVETHDEVGALVVEEANRVNSLIEQLTALTLVQSAGAPLASEPVHLGHLVRKVGAREARRRPDVDIRLPRLTSPPPIALGDEGFIAQVLTILIDNAAKFGGPHGTIDIVVGVTVGEVAVHVRDRGPGLEGVDPDRLFALFQRATPRGATVAGSGIGLYVAREIVTGMGGHVWARDRDGGGADVGFALPAAP